MSLFQRFGRYGEQWASCSTCGFDVPVSKIRYSSKYGWQCTGRPGANCADVRPDRDDYLAARRFPPGEGARTSRAPVTNTATEGKGTQTGYGDTPYGTFPYGEGGET